MPAIYNWREFALAGGLISYGPSLTHAYRQIGSMPGRTLKGEKPADIPVARSTSRLEFVINLATARAIGIEVLVKLFSISDEVIE